MKLDTTKLSLWGEVVIATAFLAASTWVLLSIVNGEAPMPTLVLAFSIHSIICVMAALTGMAASRALRALSRPEDLEVTYTQAEMEEAISRVVDNEAQIWLARLAMSNVLIAHQTLQGDHNTCYGNLKLSAQHTRAHEANVREALEAQGKCTCARCVAELMDDLLVAWEPSQLKGKNDD